MPIRPDQIDPTIQSAFKERLTQIFAQQAALDPVAARVRSEGTRLWRESAKRHLAYFWGAGASMVASIAVVPLLQPAGEGPAVLGLLLLQTAAAFLGIQGLIRTQRALTRYVTADGMRGAAHLVALTRAEKAYCEAVAGLVEAEGILDQAMIEEILAQLNELLGSYRNLEEPIRQYLATSGSASVEAIGTELADLERRHAALQDPTARSTMEQSMELCRRRLEYARAAEPARQQAEAQQELILQTLVGVQGSLARMRSTPALPQQTEVQELHESVLQINRQARAVEEAVAEVVSLGR
jgi:hypothetical protein